MSVLICRFHIGGVPLEFLPPTISLNPSSSLLSIYGIFFFIHSLLKKEVNYKASNPGSNPEAV